MPLKFSRIWCMPSPETFTMPPVKKLLERYVGDGIGWIDPFAGANQNSPAETTNDLNPSAPTKYHLEALAFIEALERHDHNGILFDPPYSLRQVKECYDHIGVSLPFDTTQDASFGKVKDAAANKIKSGGYAICCGWNTNGFGKNRGFKLIEILLCPHGGHHNDTIITVEKKINHSLSSWGE